MITRPQTEPGFEWAWAGTGSGGYSGCGGFAGLAGEPGLSGRLDLFNHGYYWEAHEMWEALWHRSDGDTVTAMFLKELIKLTTDGVKIREGKPRGAATLNTSTRQEF